MKIMAYDKSSFLAGIAAGRNMKSVPFLKGQPAGVFSFTIRADSTTTLNYQFVCRIDGIIDWGDGSRESVTREMDNKHAHSYQTGGIYEITVYGVGHGYSFWSNQDLAIGTCLLSINSPLLPPPNDVRPIYENLYTMFSGCGNLHSLPPGVFKNLAVSGVYFGGFGRAFMDSLIEYLPENLFEGIHLGTRSGDVVSILQMFMRCRKLKEIPKGLFSNPEFATITDASDAFVGCAALRVVRDGAFSGMTNLENAENILANCTSLAQAAEGLFEGMSHLKNCRSVFSGCSSLEAFPDRCFADGCTDEPDFYSLCYRCYALRHIGQDSFSPYISGRANFAWAFRQCTSIREAVPELWNMYPSANGHACFEFCRNAENYNDIPNGWKY